MATNRKPFLLRVDKEILNALQRWADDELRSLNGQIDFVLRRALREAGRVPKGSISKVDVNENMQPSDQSLVE